MDYGRGISYVRQDPGWVAKTIIGSLITMIPIVNFAATGYAMDVLRNVHLGRETPLPEWGENFGDRFVRGLLAAVIQFIYALPMIALVCALGGFGYLTALATGTENGGNAPLLVLCLLPFVVVAGLLLNLLGLVAVTRYAITDDFGQAMRVGEVVAEFRRGLGVWLGLLLMMVLAGFALVFGVTITCGLGILLSFYYILAQHHWMAQAYRQSAGSVEPSGYSL